jgi:hypothetical protein
MGSLLVVQRLVMTRTGLGPTTTTCAYNIIALMLALIATPALVGEEAGAYQLKTTTEWIATLYGAVFGICFIYVTLGCGDL